MTKDEFIRMCANIPEKKIQNGSDLLKTTTLYEIRHMARKLLPPPVLKLVPKPANDK